ncbi:hypothetical protein [Staphylococcus capitis]|uniref:hypothetical protein n=1 Tax=Staphylococcus capitis TaxID=29388 RepID=UPI0011A045A1|nr:hypothetical protein [Staphylococcus capitis]
MKCKKCGYEINNEENECTECKKNNFGIDNNEDAPKDHNLVFGVSNEVVKSTGLLSPLINIFKLEKKLYWCVHFLLSGLFLFLCFYWKFNIPISLSIINFFLYPFNQCILNHFNEIINDKLDLEFLELGPISQIIVNLLKIIISFVLWRYSVFIGPISLIYLIYIARKLG